MAWTKNITNLDAAGIFRSLNGAADENVFIGKASKAGFYCFFKVWRDMPYDAVLDYKNILYRVEVKGSSSSAFDLTRGSRSGAQINRAGPDRTRLISRNDCDFTVCVDSNNGECYIIPVDVIEILDRKNLSKRALANYKESWKLFVYNENRLSGAFTRDGLRNCSEAEICNIMNSLNIVQTPPPYKFSGARDLQITDQKDINILKIWEHLAALIPR